MKWYHPILFYALIVALTDKGNVLLCGSGSSFILVVMHIITLSFISFDLCGLSR
jgi:hypothetical protein